MSCTCIHLITNTTKIVKPATEGHQSNFLCSLKRISGDDSKVINEAYHKQTTISVAGYTCYYHNNKDVNYMDCPKHEGDKE